MSSILVRDVKRRIATLGVALGVEFGHGKLARARD